MNKAVTSRGRNFGGSQIFKGRKLFPIFFKNPFVQIRLQYSIYGILKMLPQPGYIECSHLNCISFLVVRNTYNF